MENVFVVSGNISMQEADAVITLINSEKCWFGGIDSAIRLAAGNRYHRIPGGMTLYDGDVITVRGNSKFHGGLFNNVIFVVDDLRRPLDEIVFKALKEAHRNNYKAISLPVMRTGVMLGCLEPDKKTAIEAMIKGIKAFYKEYPESEIKITIVVYYDSEAETLLKKYL